MLLTGASQPSPPEADSEMLNAALSERNCSGEELSKSNHSKRSGALSAAFKRGNAGQSNTLSASREGQVRHGGSDPLTNQSVAGTGALGKRGQFLSANHLLNFQYDPIVRPPVPRTPFSRRPHRTQPYNKELFLQANFRFLVSDFGDYLLNSSDPDKMLQWEDIAAVYVSAPVLIQCPICLENPPICPQITSCGHIFCFPCILRYLFMGEEEHKGDYFKKCPLCFATISSKALRTVCIENVQNYHVGDYMEFTLLNRAKGSVIPFEKCDPVLGSLPYSKEGQCHLFSKFTLTSDAELAANKAIAELSSWGDRVQKDAGEDMDLLPFIFAAIDQLQQRRTAWEEHRVSEFLSSSPPVRQRIMAQTKEVPSHSSSHGFGFPGTDDLNTKGGVKVDIAAETEAAMSELKDRAGWVYENAFSDEEEGAESWKSGSMKLKGRSSQMQKDREIPKHSKVHAQVSSTWEETSIEEGQIAESLSDPDKHIQQDLKKGVEDKESYAFYQSADGQPLILHPLNMKCLLQHYGSYDNLPSRLHGRIIEMEGQIQTEATRKRHRYLSHLPLTTNFQLCEVDLHQTLPSSAFIPFTEELRIRANRRWRRLKKEQAENHKEERTSAASSRYSPSSELVVSTEDIHEEELPSDLGFEENSGRAVMLSTSPALDQRKLFSHVTRLGFASAHDAPELTPSKSAVLPSSEAAFSNQYTMDSGGTTSQLSPMTFADIIQAQALKLPPNGTQGSSSAAQISSKKSRKAAKVLLSTAGGRRY